MNRFVFLPVIFFFLLAGVFQLEGDWNNVYAQTPKGGSKETELKSRPEKNPPKKGAGSGRRMRGEKMGGITTEEMRESMKDLIPPKELPFYQEKTFFVMVTAALVLLIVWFIKRGGNSSLEGFKRRGLICPRGDSCSGSL
jgi:hypothetical protein